MQYTKIKLQKLIQINTAKNNKKQQERNLRKLQKRCKEARNYWITLKKLQRFKKTKEAWKRQRYKTDAELQNNYNKKLICNKDTN